MTSRALDDVRRSDGSRPAGSGFAAVIFDLDGVVANATDLHVAAWEKLFDAAFPVLAPTGTVAPFTIDDYRAHVEGRSHEDAARAVLASRDLDPAEGEPGDGPDALTIRGLVARQRELLAEQIEAHGVMPYPTTVTLLHRLQDAGIAVGVVTASQNSPTLLAAAGIGHLFSSVIDASDATELHLSGRPAPDLLHLSATHMGVSPEETVVVEHTESGVRAAVAGGFGRVVGVDRDGNQAGCERPASMSSSPIWRNST